MNHEHPRQDIALLLVGKTEEERRLNLSAALRLGQKIDVHTPRKYMNLLVLKCGACGSQASYKTLEEIPMEDFPCPCTRSYFIKTVDALKEGNETELRAVFIGDINLGTALHIVTSGYRGEDD